MMTSANEILQNLIEGGLLMDWTEVVDNEFSFRVLERPWVDYTVVYSYSKTKKYPIEKDDKISQVELISKKRGTKNPYLKLNLFGQEDPEDIAAWLIKMVLTKNHFNGNLVDLYKFVKSKVTNYKLEKVWGEYYDEFEDNYVVVKFHKPGQKKEFILLYIYGAGNYNKVCYRLRTKGKIKNLGGIDDICSL
jgi:hypothetical protein